MRQVVVVDEQIPLICDVLHGCDVVTIDARRITNSLLKETGATSLIIRSTTLVDAALLADTKISFVGSATAGMDHIHTELSGNNHLRVVGAPGCNANAVAEYVMIWLNTLEVPVNQPVGIIGFGNVGQRLARYAIARGHRVYVNDPPLADIGYVFPELVEHVALEELLSMSSVVSVHTPMIRQGAYRTHHLIDAQLLSLMQSNSLVFNTARGGVIDESALCGRVSAGSLRCVLDVFEGEPDLRFETIQTVEHCTPHIAGYTQTAKIQGARMILKAFQAHTDLPLIIPSLEESVGHTTSETDAAKIITTHPFRPTWINEPSPETFETCRRLTPLRTEYMQPPSWEELHGHHS